MDIGTTIEIELDGHFDDYFKTERDGYQFSIAGDGSIGETRDVRIIKKQENTIIGIIEGASLRLRIDEIIDESSVKANPSYGPVIIKTPLTRGDWWECTVTDICENHITAKAIEYIPRNSDIPRGPPPEDPTQSLNQLISDRKP